MSDQLQNQPFDIQPLAKQRFDALAGYARDPKIILIVDELEWYATRDGRLIGMVTFDKINHDYGWVILGRDERHRFRAIKVNVSYPSKDASRTDLFSELANHHAEPDESFYQSDDPNPPTDFFTPVVDESRLNPIFKTLVEGINYSSALGIIKPMMRFYDDTDGNFVEQFQTTGFDARLWELYLFATFVELGYARAPGTAVPDFIFTSPFGSLGIEATTINPSNNRTPEMPGTKEEMAAYLENFIRSSSRALSAVSSKRNHPTGPSRRWTACRSSSPFRTFIFRDQCVASRRRRRSMSSVSGQHRKRQAQNRTHRRSRVGKAEGGVGLFLPSWRREC